MLFQPDGNLWDTLVVEDDDGVFHNFYLAFHGCVGHLTSGDLVHWEKQADIDFRLPGTWCEQGECLTGSIFKWEGRWLYSIGSFWNGRAAYGFAVSDDLYHWELRDIDHPVICDGEIQLPQGCELNENEIESGWHDPCFRIDKEGILHAYMQANLPKRTHRDTGAVIAHLISKDSIHWERQAPLVHLGTKIKSPSCPSVFDYNGKWYLTFIDHGSGGMRWHTSGRTDTSGTYYMVADSPDGPYEFPQNPLLLGSGCAHQDSWAGRVIKINGQPFIYSHFSFPVAVNSLKKIVQTEDYGLKCIYDTSIEELSTGDWIKICEANHRCESERWNDLGEWISTDSVITGEAEIMGSAACIAEQKRDFILRADISMSYGATAGFALRAKDYPGKSWMPVDELPFSVPNQRKAVVVRLDFERQLLEITSLEKSNLEGYGVPLYNLVIGGDEILYDCCHKELQYGKKYNVQIVVRGCYYDVYLDDELIISKSMKEYSCGDLELIVERGKVFFTNVMIKDLEPLEFTE